MLYRSLPNRRTTEVPNAFASKPNICCLLQAASWSPLPGLVKTASRNLLAGPIDSITQWTQEIGEKRSVVRQFDRSVVQFLVVSCSLPAASCQLLAASCQLN